MSVIVILTEIDRYNFLSAFVSLKIKGIAFSTSRFEKKEPSSFAISEGSEYIVSFSFLRISILSYLLMHLKALILFHICFGFALELIELV